MGTSKFFTLAELQDAVDDPNFFESDDDGATVDIVSDIEGIDETTLEDSCPRDIPGRLQVRSSAPSIASTSTDSRNNDAITTVQKRKRIKQEESRNKFRLAKSKTGLCKNTWK